MSEYSEKWVFIIGLTLFIIASMFIYTPTYTKEVLVCNLMENTCVVNRTKLFGKTETINVMSPKSISNVYVRRKRIRARKHRRSEYRIVLKNQNGSEQIVFADVYHLSSRADKKAEEISSKLKLSNSIIRVNR